jgi:serine/threonine-protein kinase HipA
MDHGAQTNEDLRELWSRIVFNVLVSNTDDHLRNHGFILVPGRGWRLSEAFDMNPVPGSSGLTLNISEADNALDLDVVRSVAPFFRLKAKAADEIIKRSQAVVRQWLKIARRLALSAQACDRMAPAFRLAG